MSDPQENAAMAQESAMRARVAGRAAVAARTVWSLSVMGLEARCVASEGSGPDKTYVIQLKTEKGWKALGVSATDPRALLAKLVSSETIRSALANGHKVRLTNG